MNSAWALVRVAAAGELAALLVERALLENLLVRHLLRSLALLWIAVELSRLFVRHVARSGALRPAASNVLTICFTSLLCLLALELIAMYLPRSHGVGYAYASRNWFGYFWSTNELGYRDKPVRDLDPYKPTIALVGDSFTAGHGIRSEGDTFAGQLRTRLAGRVEVLNLGRLASDTSDELERLQEHPSRVDLLVLQYFGNDIEKAAAAAGVDFSQVFQPYHDVGPVAKAALLRSYLLNYAYWLFPHGDTLAYMDALFGAYRDQAILARHLEDLGRFVAYARERNIPLVVVLFPFLTDLERSREYVEPVADFLVGRNVPVIDVTDLVSALPARSRIVNSNDAHPSVLVHTLVADALSEHMRSLGWGGLRAPVTRLGGRDGLAEVESTPQP
jgi:hypothetical protein